MRLLGIPEGTINYIRLSYDKHTHYTVILTREKCELIDGVATLVHVAGERGSYTVRAEFLPTDPEAYAPSTDTETLTVTDESDPGTDPGVPAAGSLSLIGLIGSIGSAGVGLHSAVSLGSLGS